MKTLLTVTLLTSFISGCAQSSHVGEYFEMSGSPEGIKSFMDGTVGIAKTSKESPDSENQYLATRRKNERENTIRTLSEHGAPKGFLQKLFSQDVTDEHTVEKAS